MEYNTIIETTKEQSKKLRDAYYKMFYILGGAFLAGFIVALPIAGSINSNLMVLAIVVWVAVMIFIGVKAYDKYKILKQFMKENVVQRILEKHFNQVQYRPEEGFEQEFIRNTEMIQMGNIYSSNDYLSGEYNGVTFSQSDVTIKDRRRSGKHTYTVTLFQGRWLVYQFNKKFDGYLQLRDTEKSIFGKNKKPYSFFSVLPEMNHLTFENDQFNEAFTAYSSNPHEAYYLITPHFMEKILKLDKKIDCQVIFGFINNELHVACYNGENAFEVATEEVNQQTIKKVEDDLQLIKDIIDYLDIDVKIT